MARTPEPSVEQIRAWIQHEAGWPWKRRSGANKRAVALLNLHQSDISRVCSGERNPTLRMLIRIAARREVTLQELQKTIHDFSEPPARHHRRRRGGPLQNVVSINRSFETWYEDLLKKHPQRARRLAMNIEQQDGLEYTDLISVIVRTIIDLGPKRAATIIRDMLEAHVESPSKAREAKRARFAAEYRALEEPKR